MTICFDLEDGVDGEVGGVGSVDGGSRYFERVVVDYSSWYTVCYRIVLVLHTVIEYDGVIGIYAPENTPFFLPH